MKTSPRRRGTQSKLPYDKQKSAQTSAEETKSSNGGRKAPDAACQSLTSPTPALSPSSSSASSSSFPPLESVRDVYLESIYKIYPDITPRHEHDIVMLGSNRIRGTKEEVLAWVDKRLQSAIDHLGSMEAVLEETRKVMEPVTFITGRKPRNAQDHAHLRPIPDSDYSIRLFPGNPTNSEYCMDIVDTATQQPVNSPFEFELWAVPNPNAPWLSMPGGCVRSLERCFGIAQQDILPGEEKWLLRDGQTCLLRRPGKRDVQFTVPRRKQSQPAAVYDADILDFPEEE